MMKRKINTLKLIIPALTLTLTLMGDIILPCTASDNSYIHPQKSPVWTEQSWSDKEEGIQPLSDIDAPNKQTNA